MLWSASGLQKSKKEFEIILKLRNIDICLISETHFTLILKLIIMPHIIQYIQQTAPEVVVRY